MATSTAPKEGVLDRISLSELVSVVHSTDEAVFLVESRVLRRVIKSHAGIHSVGLQVPHRKSFVIDREPLLELAEPDELNPDLPLPERVILLPLPDPEKLDGMGKQEVLRKYWQLLFHARIHFALDSLIEQSGLGLGWALRRIDQIGQTQFDEVLAVLRDEDFLLPAQGKKGNYVEFAAVFLELWHFSPTLLSEFFPTIEQPTRVLEILRRDVDTEGILQKARMDEIESTCEIIHEDEPDEPAERKRYGPNPKRVKSRLRRCEKASGMGNVVRSAILQIQAAQYAEGDEAESIRGSAHAELDKLIERLQEALELSDQDARNWKRGLVALLDRCTHRFWPKEARLLYDLQNVCVDHEREIYTVDLPEWLISRGKRPIQRPLPIQREVLMAKHLKIAEARISGVRLPRDIRDGLTASFVNASRNAEEILRRTVRPLILDTFRSVDLKPSSIAEEVAQHKLVEELLDRIVDRGFLTMGDLRDAISRNNLKLPDLSDFGELIRGDRLLQIDLQLSEKLDGVYRRGEIYLRWMQRVSSAAFSNGFGRFLTRYLALPFGGAFAILEFFHHLVGMIIPDPFVALKESVSMVAASGAAATTSGSTGVAVAATAAAEAQTFIEAPSSLNLWPIGLLGSFLVLLFNVERFRTGLITTLRWTRVKTVRLARWLARTLQLHRIWALLRTKWIMLIRRFLIKPALVSAFVWLVMATQGLQIHQSLIGTLVLFAVLNVALNSRVGRDVEEVFNDLLMRAWLHFRMRILSGVYWFVVNQFKRLLETIDRFLYSVDEWLRFKSGETQIKFVTKAILGSAWFLVAYVLRFCINLLLEPQVNPIKHFPVVTVSHKLLLPTVPLVLGPIFTPFVGRENAIGLAVTIATVIPGIFGFLVWELKENWKLYSANRPKRLKAVAFGHHGETVSGLIRPGFHSGTFPKLFKKLRRATRRQINHGRDYGAHKHRHSISEATRSFKRFVERELIYLLDQCDEWNRKMWVRRVRVGSNSVLVELDEVEFEDRPIQLSFEEQSGWLVGNVFSLGWLSEVSDEEQTVFRNALAGFFKMSGIDLVRAQLLAGFHGLGQFAYDISDVGLVIWLGGNYETEVIYDLNSIGRIDPKIVRGSTTTEFPPFQPQDVIFRRNEVKWVDWCKGWDDKVPTPLLESVKILDSPASTKAESVGAGVANPTGETG